MIYEIPFKLGDEVKETITGFNGIVIGAVFYLNGCNKVQIQPKKLKKEGGTQDGEWHDIQQVQLVKRSKKKKSKLSGGPMATPPQNSN